MAIPTTVFFTLAVSHYCLQKEIAITINDKCVCFFYSNEFFFLKLLCPSAEACSKLITSTDLWDPHRSGGCTTRGCYITGASGPGPPWWHVHLTGVKFHLKSYLFTLITGNSISSFILDFMSSSWPLVSRLFICLLWWIVFINNSKFSSLTVHLFPSTKISRFYSSRYLFPSFFSSVLCLKMYLSGLCRPICFQVFLFHLLQVIHLVWMVSAFPSVDASSRLLSSWHFILSCFLGSSWWRLHS